MKGRILGVAPSSPARPRRSNCVRAGCAGDHPPRLGLAAPWEALEITALAGGAGGEGGGEGNTEAGRSGPSAAGPRLTLRRAAVISCGGRARGTVARERARAFGSNEISVRIE